jgi:hypothetical protein
MPAGVVPIAWSNCIPTHQFLLEHFQGEVLLLFSIIPAFFVCNYSNPKNKNKKEEKKRKKINCQIN